MLLEAYSKAIQIDFNWLNITSREANPPEACCKMSFGQILGRSVCHMLMSTVAQCCTIIQTLLLQ